MFVGEGGEREIERESREVKRELPEEEEGMGEERLRDCRSPLMFAIFGVSDVSVFFGFLRHREAN